MLFRNRLIGSLGAVLLGLMLGGCSLSGESPQDDEREPHFVLGKSRVNALDYAGAAEAFQEALEVSPRSAAAHYQLAWLYENKLADPAAAIYHYQEYLLLDSKAGNPDVIRQHIYACKQQLVTDVMQLPSAPAAQQPAAKSPRRNHLVEIQRGSPLPRLLQYNLDQLRRPPRGARVSFRQFNRRDHRLV